MDRTGLIGGALLSLDLSKAFDSVSRELLFQGMEDLGVRRDCLHLLHEWHRGTHYDISHKGFSSAVPVHRGVRQGCKAAPFLWRCLTTSILSCLAEQTSWEWVEQCITIYADDFWCINPARPWTPFLSLFTIVEFSLIFWLNITFRSICRNASPWSPCRAMHTGRLGRHRPNSSSALRMDGTFPPEQC